MKKNEPKKAEEILSSIDSGAIKSGIEKIKSMSEEESMALRRRLQEIDKDKVLNMLSNLSADEIKQKMAGLDLSKLSKIAKGGAAIDKIKKDKKQR